MMALGVPPPLLAPPLGNQVGGGAGGGGNMMALGVPPPLLAPPLGNQVGGGAGGYGLNAALGALHPGVPLGGVAGGAAVLPGHPGATTWETLVNEAGMAERSVGLALAHTHASTPWADVVRGVQQVASRPGDLPTVNLISEYAADLHTTYYLTVVGGKMEVLHALRPCFAVAGGGARVFGLIGDRTVRSTGMEVQPNLYTLAGQPGAQAAEGFARVTMPAPTMPAMQAAFTADEELEIVPPLQANILNPPNDVTAFKTMPVHPKIACLFFKGLRIRDGVGLIARIVMAAPPELRPGMEELVAFGRLAGTSDATGNSALTSTWRIMVTVTNEALDEWYYKLVERELPLALVRTPPLPQ
jgi:hypothetical protein